MVRLTCTCAIAGAVLSSRATVGDAAGRGNLRARETNAKADDSESAAGIPDDVVDLVQRIGDLSFLDPFEGFDNDRVVPIDDNNGDNDGESESRAQDRQALNVKEEMSESKHSKIGGHFREEDDMDAEVEVESRIVGGNLEGTCRPWMAMTLDEINGQTYRGACGAAMITNQWAVTAAHCVSNYNTNDLAHKMDWLYVGAHQPWASTPNGGCPKQKVRISQIYEHPDHDAGAAQPHDIALLYLESPVTFSTFSPLKLPGPNFSPESTSANRQGIAYGFGQTWYGGQKSDELRSVAVGYVLNSVCASAMSSWDITDDMVCFAAQNKDSCGGDSGGPIVVNGDTLFGVVSWGYKCAESGFPGVYSSTFKHRSWMQTTMGSAWNSVQTQNSQGSAITYAGSQYSTDNAGPSPTPPAPSPTPPSYSNTDINRCQNDDFKVKVYGKKYKCKDAKKSGICYRRDEDKYKNTPTLVTSICCNQC